MKARLRRHLEWLQNVHLVPFTLLMAIYSFIGRLVLAIPVSAVLVLFARDDVFAASDIDIPTIYVVLIGPAVETLLSQWLPIAAARLVTKKAWTHIAFSTVVFSCLHKGFTSIFAAIAPGVILAYTFTVWREKGRFQGFLATFMTHAWINIAVTTLKKL